MSTFLSHPNQRTKLTPFVYSLPILALLGRTHLTDPAFGIPRRNQSGN